MHRRKKPEPEKRGRGVLLGGKNVSGRVPPQKMSDFGRDHLLGTSGNKVVRSRKKKGFGSVLYQGSTVDRGRGAWVQDGTRRCSRRVMGDFFPANISSKDGPTVGLGVIGGRSRS